LIPQNPLYHPDIYMHVRGETGRSGRTSFPHPNEYRPLHISDLGTNPVRRADPPRRPPTAAPRGHPSLFQYPESRPASIASYSFYSSYSTHLFIDVHSLFCTYPHSLIDSPPIVHSPDLVIYPICNYIKFPNQSMLILKCALCPANSISHYHTQHTFQTTKFKHSHTQIIWPLSSDRGGGDGDGPVPPGWGFLRQRRSHTRFLLMTSQENLIS
jgi:hypothetical protein